MTTENLQTDLELKAEIKLYYDLFVPENAEKNAPLLIALHGYGAHKKYMMREAQRIAPEGFVIAALQGFHQHWREPQETGAPPKIGFGWLTSFKAEDSVQVHHRALLDLIENLTNSGVADRNRIFLLGFSQTCALNFRFAFSHPRILRGVVGISGGIPGDWETSGAYHKTYAPVFYLYGTRDEFYGLDTFEKNSERLKTRAANYKSKVYDAAHEITDEMRGDINHWLKEIEK
jgi:phospholipase/carboxylesterase